MGILIVTFIPSYKSGHIQINMYLKEEDLIIDISDNGVGFPEDFSGLSPFEIKTYSNGNHNHIGMLNIHKIIQHFYGERYGVSVHSSKNSGTLVSTTMPIDKGENDV